MAKYSVRITSTSGQARTVDATSATADRIAIDATTVSGVTEGAMEADVLIDGEFHAAYIRGARVLF